MSDPTRNVFSRPFRPLTPVPPSALIFPRILSSAQAPSAINCAFSSAYSPWLQAGPRPDTGGGSRPHRLLCPDRADNLGKASHL